MTYAGSAVAYWVNRYNQSQIDLANQTAATVAEHNARYVNGAGSGQLWSENAAYWQGQYNSMLADRDAWTARANSAWGQNRVWNSGPSFEAQAWTGGALNNGELWSTAYNRVLPVATPYTMTWQGANWVDGVGFPGGGVVAGAVDRAGYWAVNWIFHADGSLGAQQLQLWVGGGYSGVSSSADAGGGESVHADTGNSYITGAIGAGTVLELRGDSGFSGHPLVTLRATFIPTPSYAH